MRLVAVLPQRLAGRLFVQVPAAMLREFDEQVEIGVDAAALDQEINMVGHEAVRKNRDVARRGNSQKFTKCVADDVGVVEHSLPAMRRDGNEMAAAARWRAQSPRGHAKHRFRVIA